MPRVVTPLSDMQIKNAKPQDKDYTLTDGRGLYLLIKQSGSKIWRYQYSFNGSRFLTSFGTYPAVGLLEAREKRAVYQKDISKGINPADTKKQQKEKLAKAEKAKEHTFEILLRQWIGLKRTKVTKNTADKIQRTFELYFLPFI